MDVRRSQHWMCFVDGSYDEWPLEHGVLPSHIQYMGGCFPKITLVTSGYSNQVQNG